MKKEQMKIAAILAMFYTFIVIPQTLAAIDNEQRIKIINYTLNRVEEELELNQKSSLQLYAEDSGYKYTLFNNEANNAYPDNGQNPSTKTQDSILGAKIDFSAGSRSDDLQWNIAGDINGANPNILSELTWTDLRIFQLKAGANLILDKRFLLEGSFGYGWIYRGKNQDSDYLGDNRTFEFSRSNNNSSDDDVWDGSVGLGIQFELDNVDDLVCDDAWLAVLGGWSYHKQNLKITDGFQTIPATGPFGGLNSSYQARWRGPWLGFELSGIKTRFTGFFRFEYHWANYYAEADWNLRADFAHPVSFSHTADGTGTMISFGIGYILNKSWSLNFKGDIGNWKTGHGIDRTFFANGTSVDTRLNEVTWETQAYQLGVRYYFN